MPVVSRDEEFNESDFFEHYRFEADPGQSLLRIDKFLFNRLDNVSRTRIQAAAEAGSILVNNKTVKSNYKIKPGDVISIVLPHPPREIEILAQNIPLDIIFEDEQVLVINKKAGMVVHPAYGNYSGTLINALLYHLRDNPLFQSGNHRPGLVHRIDKDTSGLLVVAKTEQAMNKLALQFYKKSILRKYVALVWGNLEEDQGTISANLGRNPKDRKKMHVFPDGTHGKTAITHYKVIERFDYVNLVECRLETGRTHQIRVHFQYIRHPLFNDPDYGGNIILRGTTFSKYRQFVNNCFRIMPRQALHAKLLGFIHPVTGNEMVFDCPLPADMQMVLEKWRNYISGRIEN
jgi:23S rRNA pseudouridine1911/1915/1917 synthase